MPKINIELDLDIDENGISFLESLLKKDELGSTFSYWIKRISQGDMILNAEEILDLVTDMVEDEEVSLDDEIIVKEVETDVMRSDDLVLGDDDSNLFDDLEDETSNDLEVINDVVKSDELEIGGDDFNFDDIEVDEIETKLEDTSNEPSDLKDLINFKFDKLMEVIKELGTNGVIVSSTVAGEIIKQKDEFDELIMEEFDYSNDLTMESESSFTPEDFIRLSKALHG